MKYDLEFNTMKPQKKCRVAIDQSKNCWNRVFDLSLAPLPLVKAIFFSENSIQSSYIRCFMKLFYKREKEWIWKSQVHHTTIWYSWQQVCVAFKWGISTFPNKKLMLGNNKEQSYNSRWNSPKFIRIFIVCSRAEILTIDSQISNL